MKWKEDEELHCKASYVQKTGAKTYGQRKYWYFYCNRSGSYQARGKGERLIKTQGSCKLGAVCSSYIKAYQELESNTELVVEYCATHHNHDHELAHLPIPKEVAMEISYKLQQGIAMDKILDDIRDEGGTVTVGRQHLINKQDITNIKRKLNIDGIQMHENDHFSVCAWVQEMEQIDYNPVTLFKAQGVEGNGKLKKEDFVIGIQTEFQKDLMEEYGGNIICMDATHGTNV